MAETPAAQLYEAFTFVSTLLNLLYYTCLSPIKIITKNSSTKLYNYYEVEDPTYPKLHKSLTIVVHFFILYVAISIILGYSDWQQEELDLAKYITTISTIITPICVAICINISWRQLKKVFQPILRILAEIAEEFEVADSNSSRPWISPDKMKPRRWKYRFQKWKAFLPVLRNFLPIFAICMYIITDVSSNIFEKDLNEVSQQFSNTAIQRYGWIWTWATSTEEDWNNTLGRTLSYIVHGISLLEYDIFMYTFIVFPIAIAFFLSKTLDLFTKFYRSKYNLKQCDIKKIIMHYEKVKEIVQHINSGFGLLFITTFGPVLLFTPIVIATMLRNHGLTSSLAFAFWFSQIGIVLYYGSLVDSKAFEFYDWVASETNKHGLVESNILCALRIDMSSHTIAMKANGLFTVNSSFAFKIISFVVTYGIVAVQFESTMKPPICPTSSMYNETGV